MIDIRCKVCEYCYELKKTGNTKSAFYCNHPNQRYIEDYFKKKRMVKAPGFLNYGNVGETVPIKTSPKWCPRKEQLK